MGCSSEFTLPDEYWKLLLNWGVDPNLQDSSGKTVLHMPKIKQVSVEMLVEAGANVNVQDNSGDTPLHITAATGRTAVAMTLLNGGASPSMVNKKKQTAYDIAAASENLDCFKQMFNHATETARKTSNLCDNLMESEEASDALRKWKEAYNGLKSKLGQVQHEKIQELSPEQ